MSKGRKCRKKSFFKDKIQKKRRKSLQKMKNDLTLQPQTGNSGSKKVCKSDNAEIAQW
jgi:hypothetical protein